MAFLIGFAVLFVAFIGWIALQSHKAGPVHIDPATLASGERVRSATRADPGTGWSNLGTLTTADGLNLKFDHDDDPQAEACFLPLESETSRGSSIGRRATVRLTNEFETYHVHNRGYVFQVRVRGSEPVVGKEIRIQMHVHGNGEPHCGKVENDDDTDAAVGGWIEFDEVSILRV